MILGPFTEMLEFLSSHQECTSVTLDLARTESPEAHVYSIQCTCGAAFERPIPGPDARYCVILRCLTLISEN
jgi:hypothetical protein